MLAAGKTIQIYCPSGDPRGVRIAEITTRIVQAVVVPRARLDEAVKREELAGVGVYFLFGESESAGLPVAYIGEAEDCGVRLKDHNKKKDFWNIGVAIVSRTGSFTKAHAKLLEWMAIEKAKLAGRYDLDNGNAGGKPNVPEWMAADVAEIFETLDVLLGTLGHPIFEASSRDAASADQVFMCRRGGSDARGVYNEEGFVVLKGSIARQETTSSSHDTVGPKREEMIGSGLLTRTPQGYRFERDVIFSSPSAAASLVTGGSANGWIEWRNARGQTLDDVYRKTSDSEE